jgi:hypothetical protein
MCGEDMQLETKERTETLPGGGAMKSRTVREWICKECDYFEEAEEETTKG